jgi:trans-aconitate methyltransferase
VDVGCAEGYYAVGMALRLPNAVVHAFDVDPKAQQLCAEVARLNGVSDRVHVASLCTPQDLQALLVPRALVILDIEGSELELLQPDLASRLAEAVILVELHDFVDPSISGTIKDRFSASHTIDAVVDARTEPVVDWPALVGLSRRDRAKAMDEQRPVLPYPMQWMLLRPRKALSE